MKGLYEGMNPKLTICTILSPWGCVVLCEYLGIIYDCDSPISSPQYPKLWGYHTSATNPHCCISLFWDSPLGLNPQPYLFIKPSYSPLLLIFLLSFLSLFVFWNSLQSFVFPTAFNIFHFKAHVWVHLREAF